MSMASSSTSSVPKSFKYDVFLSFRGEDTRKNFVDHLYHALLQENIDTYKDDENMVKGEQISDELIKAIEDSRFYVIVFSKTYASSSWCLDELVKIMEECQKTTDHTAYPVFYDVEPTEVRKQRGAVGEAFAKRRRMDEDAGKWRKVLEEAAGLDGFVLNNTANGHEAQFIKEIVKVISQKLNSINFIVDEKLVGLEHRIKDVVSSSEFGFGFDDVRMIGIKGIGGGGKTTLARAIFNQISHTFEGKSFVNNVREVSKSSLSGLKSLQEQILSNVLGKIIIVNDVDDGKKILKKKMCGRKVLVVLDDVDHIDHLAALVEKNWFGPGSRIIITTRDEHVLAAHRVNLIHDVNLLSPEEAICLFSRHAFEREIPIQGYEELSGQVVHYAAGLPLTVKVLGSFLCDKDELEWKDTLERLKTIPLKETLEKLELSYKGLEDDYKEIFLDVACFMKGWRKEKAIRVLEICGFNATIGLRVLEQKSLITISEYGSLDIHDHLQEMGRNIVRHSHPDEPKKHSRLWIDEEIEEILAEDLGTEATRCIKPFIWILDPKLVMKGFGNMKKLRFLDVCFESNDGCSDSDRKFDEVRPCILNALRYLRLERYPFKYLPKTFQANNLVALQLGHSRIEQLWEGGERKVLKKLRFLELIYINLKTIDCGLIPNLETLRLEGCPHLVELHMHGGCLKLESLNVNNSKLKSLDLGRTPNLKTLVLDGCCDLVEIYMNGECLKLKSLEIFSSKLSCLDLRHTPNLETLKVFNCVDLVQLHMPIEYLKLISLSLNLSKLSTLDFRLFPNLKTLCLFGCNDLEELHMRDSNNVQLWEGGERKVLDKLKHLELYGSKWKTLDLGLIPNLETLSLEKCDELVELHMPIGCLKLESLKINNSKLKGLDLGRTPNLVQLILEGCCEWAELHMSVECPKLISLNLSLPKLRTLGLGGTPNLKTLYLYGCYELEKLHMPVGCPKLKFLNVIDSKLTTFDLGRTLHLETLDLDECVDFVELHMPVECPKLISLNLRHSKLRTLDIRLTPNLKSLHLEGCNNLVELHAPVGCLKQLVELNLSGCMRITSPFFSKIFRSLEVGLLAQSDLIVESVETCLLHYETSLPKFRFEFSDIEDLLSLIKNLEKLISAGLYACVHLQIRCSFQYSTDLTLNGSILKAHKDLDQFECLEELSSSFL